MSSFFDDSIFNKVDVTQMIKSKIVKLLVAFFMDYQTALAEMQVGL